jgi:hypothetical protein
MLKYVSKFAMDILPSVAATIIGAYIVNHYIVNKPAADAPTAAVSSAGSNKAGTGGDANPSGPSTTLTHLPGPGVTAKGISEKAMREKTAGEKPAVAERPAVAEKPAEKSADKPTETASIPAETRRHQPGPREKASIKSVGVPVQPPTPALATAPAVTAPNTVPAVEATMAPEDHRDANELARAAIERLRGAGDGSPRPQEASRIADPPRIPDVPRGAPPPYSTPVASSPPVRPLPPPIMVSTPATETSPPAVEVDNPQRPTPPADIPSASPPGGPLDLRAEAAEPPRREHTNVAEDMLLAAKSVFHAVLPK